MRQQRLILSQHFFQLLSSTILLYIIHIYIYIHVYVYIYGIRYPHTYPNTDNTDDADYADFDDDDDDDKTDDDVIVTLFHQY